MALTKIEVNLRYGPLIETFNNGCLVIAIMPQGWEIALTRPGRQSPIRTIHAENGRPGGAP